jgi:integrase
MATRARRRRFDDKAVARLRPKAKRYSKPDSELIGHYVRVMPSGVKSYVAVARSLFGKQIWTTIGATDHIGIEDARVKAREIIARVKAGKDATEPPPPAADSFAVVAANWLRRHVEARALRTRHEIERCLRRYVYPHWQNRPFTEIKRSDVARLLDHIEDEHGARQADAVLTIIRSICTWYSTRDDNYVVPIVRGMKRATNGSRERILDDHELRAVWRVAEDGGAFGALLQLALLTGQRKAKLLGMRWSDISADGVWAIPVEVREKGNGGELVLPESALAILRRQPRVLGSDFVFPPASGAGEVSSSHGMLKIRAALPKNFPQFTIHDLRRSCRSLMSRAGVNSEHAERVLGHVIGGAEGIYDRHSYRDEKRIALEKLAALIAEIVDGNASRQARADQGAAVKKIPIRDDAEARRLSAWQAMVTRAENAHTGDVEFGNALNLAVMVGITKPLLDYIASKPLSHPSDRAMLAGFLRQLLGRVEMPRKGRPRRQPAKARDTEQAERNAAYLVASDQADWRRQHGRERVPTAETDRMIREARDTAAWVFGVPVSLISEYNIRKARKSGRVVVP